MGKHGDAMPKLRQPPVDPFRRLMDSIWPYVLDKTPPYVANVLGVSRQFLYRRRAVPGNLSLHEIEMLQRICEIPDEVIMEALPWHTTQKG